MNRVPAGGISPAEDSLFDEAARLVVATGKASTSLLQRRLRIGYGRAARLLDIMEHEGIIGPPDGSKARNVLVGIQLLRRSGQSGLAARGKGRGGVRAGTSTFHLHPTYPSRSISGSRESLLLSKRMS